MKKLKQKSNVLLLRMLFLLAMVLTGSSASWAWQGYSTVTLTSNTSASTELAEYTLSGINEGDVAQAQVNGVNQNFYKLGDDYAFVRIEFVNGSDHHKFMPGDELSVTMLVTQAGKAGYRLKSASRSNVEIDATANSVVEVTRTLTADDIDADGKLTIYRANGVGYACRYYKFSVKCVRYGTDIFVSSNDVTKGTAKLQVSYAQDGETNVPLNTDAVAVSVKSGSNVEFTATPASGKLFWYWKKNGADNYDDTNPLKVYGVTENLNYQAVFTDGVKHYVYTNDANIGEVHIERNGNDKGKEIHVNPGTPNITFVATEKVANSFKGWFTNVERTTPAPDGADGTKYTDKTYKLTGDQLNNGLTLFAKFEATTKPFTVTADWTPTIPANAAGWGLATVHVKVDGVDVDASEYTLNYEVVDGHLSLADGSKNATVTGGFNDYETAHVKVTATPKDATKYTAGTVTFDVNIKKLAKPNITVNPKTVRIGESVTIGVTRETNFTNPHYEWTLSDNAKTCLYGYTAPISETQAANTDNPTHKFVAKEPTTSPISVNLKFYSDNGYYNNTTDRLYEEANAAGNNGITVKPVAVPTVTEDADGVHFTYEQDYDGANGRVDAYLEYFVGEPKADNSNRVQNGFGDNLSTYTATNIPQGIRIYVKSVIHYKDANDEDVYVASSEVQYVTDKPAELPEVQLMKQPRWANGDAKRYIPIGKIDEANTSLWPEGVDQGMGAIKENTMGYILNGGSPYTIDKEDKGLLISQYGKTSWGWNEGKTAYIPKSAAFYMDVAGTLDVILFVENSFNNGQNDDLGGYNENRRWIKVWYLNDQCKDGKPVQMASWGIVGKRVEGNTTGGGELRLHVRLPQLGTNGKTTLFFTYEGDGYGNDVSDAEHNLWVRGFLIKRPDLPNSIGRTDDLYNSDPDNLTHMCVPTKNTPYVWSFEPKVKNSAGNNIHTDGNDAVGFRPASDVNEKKTNENDGRIYICGEKDDHLLIYSDNYDVDPENPVTPLTKEERPELDGRSNRDGDSHIELVRPTKMAGHNGNDNKFNPIRSNGLKVNVTGSGWFKVVAAAPYCDVNMKVLASTNGGMSTIRVLKEFTVKKSSEMGWKDSSVESEFTAYLKAQVNDYGTYDEDGATGDPEKKYMSLYVVFEAANADDLDTDGKVKGTSDYPQLNIHQMSWLNELPMDYVFQREENPKLLTEIQTVRRAQANGMQDYKADRALAADAKDNVVLRWQASNPYIKETISEDDTEGVSTFDRINQTQQTIGQKSIIGSVSREGDNNNDNNKYYWDIAANPAVGSHTEAAQRYTDKYHYTDGTNGTDDNRYVLGNAEKEFGLPISGSFYRLYPEKNGHVVAYVIPTVANQSVYVLDETGAPVSQLSDQNAAYNTWTQAEKAHGVVKTVSGAGGTNGVYSPSSLSTIRLDILVSAGKEYFICGSEPISLAALHWYQTREGDATAATLENEGENTDVINAANSGAVYRNVTLNRSFTAGQWASLVLPFSMNELKFQEVFGKDAICIHFDNIDLETNTVNLVHHYYNMIVAGRPVFVRPSADGSIFTNGNINGVTLQAGDVIPTNADGIVFTGNIGKATMPKNSLFMRGNAIMHTTEAKEVKAMRAWIQGGDVLKDINKPSSPAPVARLLNYDGTLLDGDIATGIESALAEAGMDAAVISASTVIYNLQGNKVATGAEMQNLPAGVYVVKGKKFIVK